jgi:hypothetical protein
MDVFLILYFSGSIKHLGAYLNNIDKKLSIYFGAVYSVSSFRHDFSRNPPSATPENLDSGSNHAGMTNIDVNCPLRASSSG